jgi:hypothetical protein
MATAKFIRRLDDWHSVARLYRLSEPVEKDDGNETDYVVVSASVVLGEPETLVFPSDMDGNVERMIEIGGERGTLNHAEVLKNMGFTVEMNGRKMNGMNGRR